MNVFTVPLGTITYFETANLNALAYNVKERFDGSAVSTLVFPSSIHGGTYLGNELLLQGTSSFEHQVIATVV